VYGIVKQSGGFIQVTSEVTRGVISRCFSRLRNAIYLNKRENGEPAPRTRGTETVLLVENEEDVRQVIAGILARSGFQSSRLTIRERPSSSRRPRAGDRSPDQRYLDAAYQRIPALGAPSELKTGLKVILMSGYHDRIVEGRGEAGSDISFIAKPLDPEQFLITVRSVLDSR
jgi:DNA-binding NtrC family response regulator